MKYTYDYVSFELAKLLGEHNFPYPKENVSDYAYYCDSDLYMSSELDDFRTYYKQGEFIPIGKIDMEIHGRYGSLYFQVAPSYNMVLQWIADTRGIHIYTTDYISKKDDKWHVKITALGNSEQILIQGTEFPDKISAIENVIQKILTENITS